MAAFDPHSYRNKLSKFIAIADAELEQKYAQEIDDLKGLSEQEIKEFGGTTSQMQTVINELEKATQQNLSQAALIKNIKELGDSSYQFAKTVSDLIP
jgi:translation initiation factor 2B subunit (eIF-2B alpha/beta/delta family)